MKTLLKYTFLTAAIAAFAGMANATPMLVIYSGSWLVIADGCALDSNLQSGVIDYTGSLGNWTINMGTAVVGGSQTSPELSLTFSATSNSDSNGPLLLFFSNDNLGPTQNGTISTSISGKISGAGTVSYFNNLTPSGTTASLLLTAGGPLVGDQNGDYSSSVSGVPFSSEGFYSLTEAIKITNLGVGQTASGVYSMIDPPVPVPDSGTTLMLLGAGLMGLSVVSRSRRRSRCSAISLAV
jgi:hypothetical protein